MNQGRIWSNCPVSSNHAHHDSLEMGWICMVAAEAEMRHSQMRQEFIMSLLFHLQVRDLNVSTWCVY